MTSKDFKKLLARTASNQAVGKSLNTILREENDVTFLQALVDFGNWPSRPLGEEVKKVPTERRLVVLLDAFCAAVDSGGIEQVVVDPDLGGLTQEVVSCLKRIEATSALDYLERIASLFPQQRIPEDESARVEMIEEIKRREQIPNFRILNKEFAGAVTDAIAALRSHISQNQADFESILAKPV